MKKYNLQAEFKTWKGNQENGDQRDFLTYITDFDTRHDAETRLKSLIVERMSSRYGWKYKLLSSSITEFGVKVEEHLEPVWLKKNRV